MKKWLIGIFVLIGTSVSAQDIVATIASEICDCIKAKNLNLETISASAIEGEFTSCFFTSFGAHTDEVQKAEGVDLNDEDKMGKFGEKVALKMLNYCPNVMLAMGKAADQAVPSIAPVITIEGEVVEIKTSEFVTIVVKDKNGRVHNLLLLTYFDTASVFTDGQLNKKDKISASYSELDLYDPKTKEFHYYKVISNLQKK